MIPSIDPSRREPDHAPMEVRIARIDTPVEHLNANVADLRAAVVRVDAKVDTSCHELEAKIDAVEQRLEGKIDGVEWRLEVRFEGLSARVDRHFGVLGGMIASLGIGMAGLIAEGFHWL